MSNDFKEATESYQANTTLWFGKHKGVACKKTGRHFIGIEKDETYFKLAVERVSAYCG